MKPGWKTTEFWIALGVNVVALMALFGVFTPEDTEAVKKAIDDAVIGVFAVVNNAIYIWSRTRLKQGESV